MNGTCNAQVRRHEKSRTWAGKQTQYWEQIRANDYVGENESLRLIPCEVKKAQPAKEVLKREENRVGPNEPLWEMPYRSWAPFEGLKRLCPY